MFARRSGKSEADSRSTTALAACNRSQATTKLKLFVKAVSITRLRAVSPREAHQSAGNSAAPDPEKAAGALTGSSAVVVFGEQAGRHTAISNSKLRVVRYCCWVGMQ